jgi:hypothetical protein
MGKGREIKDKEEPGSWQPIQGGTPPLFPTQGGGQD